MTRKSDLLDEFTAALSNIGLLDGEEGIRTYNESSRQEEFDMWRELCDYYRVDND